MPGESEDPTGGALTTSQHLSLTNESSCNPSPFPTISASVFPEATLDLNSDNIYQLNVPYATCEVLVAIAAVAGNALVLAAFRRERRLRRRTNYYIVSLAAADFLVGLLGIPVAVLSSVGLPSGLHWCLLAVCLLVVLCTISIFCLVAVSVDRYWAILHPMAYSRNVRTKTAVGIICACWVAGTFVGFLPLLGWNAGPQQRCLFTEVMDYNYLVFLYFATIIVPALLLAAFYAHIYRVVLQQLRQMVTMDAGPRINGVGREGSGRMLRMLGAAQRREVKATQNLAIIVLFFILCWIPLYTVNCVKAFCPDCNVEGPLTYFCIILSHLNSAVNPLLYAYHLRDFRAALRAIFGGARRRRMQRHKFLHLHDDGPGITHAASAPAAIRGNATRDIKKPQEMMPHISAAALSSTRCLVATAGYPEALSPGALRGSTPPRRSPPPLHRVMSEGGACEYRKKVSKIPRTSAASCPEAEVRYLERSEIGGAEDEEEITGVLELNWNVGDEEYEEEGKRGEENVGAELEEEEMTVKEEELRTSSEDKCNGIKEPPTILPTPLGE